MWIQLCMQVVRGSSGRLPYETLKKTIKSLHKVMASLAPMSKSEDSPEEHVLENFHSSRTIKRLVLESPIFAWTLWKKALKGKNESWAKCHRWANLFLLYQDVMGRDFLYFLLVFHIVIAAWRFFLHFLNHQIHR